MCSFGENMMTKFLISVIQRTVDADVCYDLGNDTGLQIIFQNLSDIMSGRNEIPSDIYENMSDINFYKNFIKS